MAKRMGMRVTGHKKLVKQFRNLSRKSTAKKIQRRAINKAATPLLRAAKAEVPVDEGTLKDAQIKTISTRGYGASGQVGADKAVVGEDGALPHKYDHLVHDGYQHANGVTVPGNPYLARAQEKSASQSKAIYEAELKAGIEKAIDESK